MLIIKRKKRMRKMSDEFYDITGVGTKDVLERIEKLETKVDAWIKRMDENMHGLIRDYNETNKRLDKLE